MAKIEAEGFVQEVKGNWLIKLEEPHRRQVEPGDGANPGRYETVARTFRDVKIPKGSPLDFSEFQQQDRVRVIGREVTEVREHQGKKHYTLTVWADSVELLWRQGAQGGARVQQQETPWPDEPWSSSGPTVDQYAETPF